MYRAVVVAVRVVAEVRGVAIRGAMGEGSFLFHHPYKWWLKMLFHRDFRVK